MADSASGGGISPGRYRDYLLKLARNWVEPRLRTKIDPSDIVQEALLKAQRAIGGFRGQTEQQLAAWLRTILANTLANAVRNLDRQKDHVGYSLDAALEQSAAGLEVRLADNEPSPEDVAAHNEQLLHLSRALAGLPDDQRGVLELKHLQGLTVAEICERTGRSKASVVGLLYRAVRALRILMDESDRGGDVARL